MGLRTRIEDLYNEYQSGNNYIQVVQDGTDYLVAVSGSYYYRGQYKIRRFDQDGNLLQSTGWIQGDQVDGQYVTLFGKPFSNDGVDKTPRIDKPNGKKPAPLPETPESGANLTTITNDFNNVDGYGELNLEAALEEVLQVDLPSQPPVAGDYAQSMYGLDRMGAPEAWAAGYTGAGIVVAVIDSGVDINHVDLNDNIWINTDEIAGDGIDNDGNGYIDDVTGWNTLDGNNDITDEDGHGTHVAGTIAAENNGIGVVGAAYDVKIMPVKALGLDGGTWDSVTEAIYYAVDNGAHVINMSLGGGTTPAAIVTDAIKYASDNGVTCVMASGNDNLSIPGAPATYASEYGIAVGAVDNLGNRAGFSNDAGGATDWDGDGSELPLYITASGVAIYSTAPIDGIQNFPTESTDGYAAIQGTSMACPHVAAAVAILLQADPTLTPEQIRVVLANSAV